MRDSRAPQLRWTALTTLAVLTLVPPVGRSEGTRSPCRHYYAIPEAVARVPGLREAVFHTRLRFTSKSRSEPAVLHSQSAWLVESVGHALAACHLVRDTLRIRSAQRCAPPPQHLPHHTLVGAKIVFFSSAITANLCSQPGLTLRRAASLASNLGPVSLARRWPLALPSW